MRLRPLVACTCFFFCLNVVFDKGQPLAAKSNRLVYPLRLGSDLDYYFNTVRIARVAGRNQLSIPL
jgi:hypothetical protein